MIVNIVFWWLSSFSLIVSSKLVFKGRIKEKEKRKAKFGSIAFPSLQFSGFATSPFPLDCFVSDSVLQAISITSHRFKYSVACRL